MSSPSEQTVTITSRFIFPVGQPPLARGNITIGAGRIVAVEASGTRTADLDLGNAAILPGFVNAHAHLDLSGLRGVTPPTADFVGWLRQVINQRRQPPPLQVQHDIELGIAESLAAGTTLIGDITAGGQSWDVLANSPLRSVVFYELLGLSKPRAHQSWAAACAWLRSLPYAEQCRPGLSPHAPYSVRASLFEAACRLAKARNLPVAVHIAESPAELELLERRSGPMVPFLEGMGVYDPSGLVQSLPELLRTLADHPHQLLVHGNYLRPSIHDLTGKNVVYCPRTHHAFGHATYPLADYLRSGVRIALGTDSLASNPDLSLFNEARFVRQAHGGVTSSDIMRMATLNGAEALGWDRDTGDLTPGKVADLAIVALPDRESADPADLVLDESSSISGVMIAGNWYKDPRKNSKLSQGK
jgi:cytosine/adenosine deaminase-related metal-dependent hydrolase